MNTFNSKTIPSLTAAIALAFAPAAFAGHGRHGGHYRGHYSGYYGGHHRGYYGHHYRGHYNHAGNWIAGAIVAGAVVSLIADATAPRTVYYERPRVVYEQPPVVYEQAPPVVVQRRVVYTTGTVYADPYGTRYIRDDGYRGN
jgi:hypothetical protein